MFPGINPAGQQFVQAVNRIQTQLQTAQQQISSGLKVNQPSDAPDQISPILQLEAQLQQTQGLKTNLSSVQTTVNAAEQALSNSVDLLQQASVVATQATGISQTANTRATLAQNIEAILQQMVSNSQTLVNGKYVFSGDQDQTALYQLDLTAPTGVDRLAIATSTNLVQGFGGAQFSVSQTANTIFDHRNPDDSIASDNVFAALNGLRTALLNNDSAGIQTSIGSLQNASNYMNNQLAFYGAAQSRIASALDDTQNYTVQLQTQLSNSRDADETAAIVALTQGQTQLQAALESQARMPRTTLFDVLP